MLPRSPALERLAVAHQMSQNLDLALALPSFYKDKSPPKFGHGMLKYFSFYKDYTNMNHGAYGSCPIPVQDATKPLYAQAEGNPDLFHRFTYIPLLVAVRERVAQVIGVKDADEVVMVANATTGVMNVLHNLIWERGDVLVQTTTTYGAVNRALQYLSDVPPHPTVSTFTITLPNNTHAKVLEDWRKHLQSLNEARKLLNPRGKIVAVIDGISSTPGIALPWEEMTKICKEENVYSLIDAAHSIGQQPNINLDEAAPDFWISNCHKWLFAKRSAAVFYVPKRNQHLIKTSMPTSAAYISPDLRKPGQYNFVDQFEWAGTVDLVNYLSVIPALTFREWLGGEDAINKYCHALAIKGGKKLAEVMGTEVLDDTDNHEWTWNMTNVALPISSEIPFNEQTDNLFRTKMLYGQKIFGGHYRHNGRWWTRASAQVWSELEDFEKLGRAYLAVCPEIEKEVLGKVVTVK